MDAEKISNLEGIIKATDLIESCQAKRLITPEERQKYFKQLNDKAHTAIEALVL